MARSSTRVLVAFGIVALLCVGAVVAGVVDARRPCVDPVCLRVGIPSTVTPGSLPESGPDCCCPAPIPSGPCGNGTCALSSDGYPLPARRSEAQIRSAILSFSLPAAGAPVNAGKPSAANAVVSPDGSHPPRYIVHSSLLL
jgi:hypothetical protein